MRQIGAFEAKNRFSELLAAVENGEEVTITKHGRPVARLVPFTTHDEARVAAAIAELRDLRRKVRLGPDESLKDLVDEGRRGRPSWSTRRWRSAGSLGTMSMPAPGGSSSGFRPTAR